MLMLPAKESLTVEFKSEQKRPQSHDEIVDTVVALANTEGGTLYLGIEDDGTVTGVCDEHRNINGSVKPTLTYERGALIREEVQTFSLWPLLLNGYRYSKARGVHVQHQCSGCGS